MLSFNQSPSTHNAPESGSESVVFTPLDDWAAYEILDAIFERESHKQSLAEAGRIDDDEVLGALVDCGFTPATLPALQMVPIVFAAWASDTVTEKESQAAVSSLYESRLYDCPAAMAKVQSWLDERPDPKLWELWAAVTRCQLSEATWSDRRIMSRQLIRQATSVAMASGGFMGIGRVCAAEKGILDGIRDVFDVSTSFPISSSA